MFMVVLWCGMLLFGGGTAFAASLTNSSGDGVGSSSVSSHVTAPPKVIIWKLLYEETFDLPFREPSEWTEDTYGPASPYHVDIFDEDGDFFVGKYGNNFLQELKSFKSFRKSYSYGRDGWLTVESYGRGEKNATAPATGGKFVAGNGKAKLIVPQPTDAAIIRSTKPLPRRYRVEVTVSDIKFGGLNNGSWYEEGRINGYKQSSRSPGPWSHEERPFSQNGVYFLCIADYPNPAPHNSVFWHHHRKVVMDTDNNNGGLLMPGAVPWSKVWNPRTGSAETDGSHYVAMIWLQGKFGNDIIGNEFTSYTPGGWRYDPTFVDKYLPGESYVFAVERDDEKYTMSVSGKFYHGGVTTYRASRGFREVPTIWHYNQTPEEYPTPLYNETKNYNGQSMETWPAGSSYPDYFFFGDPHIQFYEGTAEFDNVRLFVPQE